MDDEMRYGSGAAVHRGYEGEGETATAERRPEVREATDRLQMGLEGINSVIASMEERLHDLLGPERPMDGKPHGEIARMTTYGGMLHQLADGFAYQERRLHDLLDRLRDGI